MQKMRSLGLVNVLALIYLGVICLLPLHAFFTTWLGSSFGHLDLWRIWKELIIVGSVPLVLWLVWQRKIVIRDPLLVWLIAAYMALTVGLGLVALAVDRVSTDALIYGLLANLRFVGFFLLVAVITVQTDVLKRHIGSIVLWGGLAVVVFGILQITVLPYDFLRHFGYGPDTIPAYHTIDSKVDYQRIQSTLRGPNPLGAYLVIIGTLILAYWRARLPKMSWQFMTYGIGVLAVLLFSYSRSAYIGLFCSVLIVLITTARPRHRRYMAIGFGVLLALFVGLFFVLRNNDAIQNALLHTDENSHSAQSSNMVRSAAIKNGLRDVAYEPLGRGPGTAGPASTRNTYPARIAENYYIQIAQEVGWPGLALFVASNIYVGWLLWVRRKDTLALVLFASLIGLTIVNLVSHAWADDVLGLLWWGLAGVALGPAILRAERTRHVGP